jgi:tetratricopeptide (TPR) repeat protein
MNERLLILGILLAGLGFGADAEPWVGREVVLKYEAQLKVDGKVVDTVNNFRVYKVEEVKDDAVRVVSDERSGWLPKADVVPFDQAIDFFTKEIDANPKDFRPLLMRGRVWYWKDEYAKAIADFDRAAELAPGEGSIYLSRSQVYFWIKEFDKALAESEKFLKIHPDNPYGYSSRGLILEKQGHLEEALKDYDKAIELDPKVPKFFTVRALIRYGQDDNDRAIADFTEAIRLGSRDAFTLASRGAAYEERGNLVKAAADFNQPGKELPALPADLTAFVKGLANFGQAGDPALKNPFGLVVPPKIGGEKDDFDRAIDDYTSAIQIDPKNAAYLEARGSVWLDKGEFDKAIADCNEANRLDPKNAAVLRTRAMARYAKEEYQLAMADYSEAIKLDPKDDYSYLNRGKLLLEANEFDKALVDLNEARHRRPGRCGATSPSARAKSIRLWPTTTRPSAGA